MRNYLIIILAFFVSSCVSIPKETVTLSQTLGNDLNQLHNSHKNFVELYYSKIKDDINRFIDDTYSPFIIHFVLKKELEKHLNGEESIYGIIEAAGQNSSKESTDEALLVMQEFQEAANFQIQSKRTELLEPIVEQEKNLIQKIDAAYENAIYANATLTAYLQSAKKVKDSQKEALNMIGLNGADTLIDNKIINASEQLNKIVLQAKEIDVKSDEAYNQIETITNQIKQIINK